MKIAVVTTFNKKLYDDYAHKFLETYFVNWPFDLHIYSEETFPIKLEKGNEKRVTLHNIFKEDPDCKAFVDRNKNREPIPPEQFRGTQYDYLFKDYKTFRHESVRFAYKVYSYCHFLMNNKKYNGVICIDADSVFYRKIEQDWFLKKKIIKKNSLLSYLGRGPTRYNNPRGYHMEAGFLYFNMNHPETINFAKEMKRWYNKDLIYDVPEQHDSYIWDMVREKFEKQGVSNNDIGDGKAGHVQARTCLGKIYDHVKGRKPKKVGYSENWRNHNLKNKGS